MWSREQLKAVSGILANLGQVCTASIVVPFVFPTFSNQYFATILLGSLLALIFWSISVLLVKNLE